MKYAVFSCCGLGDGLITLTLSHNLQRAGHEVTTFHPFLQSMQDWFPQLPLRPVPEEFETELRTFDRFIFFFEESVKMQRMIRFCEENFPERTFVLNSVGGATRRHDIPYWETGRFDADRPLVMNLLTFCREKLGCEKVELKNGITPPTQLTLRKHPKRVLIHPLSKGCGWKNWPKAKFIRLARALKAQGFDPVFIIASYEREGWEDVEAPTFNSLSELTAFVYESGYLIGNDSGMGHLASSLGVPPLTICRSHRFGTFWLPAWTKGALIVPHPLIPNSKFLRLRDRHWKKWVTVGRVMKSFHKLRASHEVCCL